MDYFADYTSFTHLNSSDVLEKIANKIYEIRNNGRMDFHFYRGDNEGDFDNYSAQEILQDLQEKNLMDIWDEWEDDMKFLSKAFPDIVLHLKGIGEEDHNDIWRAHFLNGKVQICVIPEFDPDKLQ